LFPLRLIDASQAGAAEEIRRLRDLLSPRGDIVSPAGRQRTLEVFGEPLSPQQVVDRIVEEVCTKGLPALLTYSRKLDGAELTKETLCVPTADIAAAHRWVDADYLNAIRTIRDNIIRYQTAILHKDVTVSGGDEDLRVIYRPVRRVGICVPGGAAAYPSTLLMAAAPAQVAGVEEIAVMAPPTPKGAYNPYLLAACEELGVREVYRMGGAQGVAAFAFGVDGVPPVDMIVGPGNLFVTLAKQKVAGIVGIDMLAGPTEVVVLADHTANPAWVAADLLAQAEHAPGASILITWHRPLVDGVKKEIARQLERLERNEEAKQSLEAYGCAIVVADEEAGRRLSNEIAPEHLQVSTENPEATLAGITNAGAIFLGGYTPVAVGDYVAGPSHTLPTAGAARFAGPLSANTFLKASSVVGYSKKQLESTAAALRTIAAVEGLTAHSASVDVRLEK
jgi:histidinol dehydrogenase